MVTAVQHLFDDTKRLEDLVPSAVIRECLLYAAITGHARDKQVMMVQMHVFYKHLQDEAMTKIDGKNFLPKKDKEELRKKLLKHFKEAKFIRAKLKEIENPVYTGAFIRVIEQSGLPNAKAMAEDMRTIARLGGISPSHVTTPPQTPRQAPPPLQPTPTSDQPVTPKAKPETEEQRSFNELLEAWIRNVMAWLKEANAKLDQHLEKLEWRQPIKQHAIGTPAIAGLNGTAK